MAAVKRYTKDLVERFVGAGYWGPEYPVDFWRRNADERPDVAAIAAPDGRYTWQQATDRIARMAAGLVRDGWRHDDVLVLQAPNSAELLLLRLACEAAGVVSALVPFTFSHAEIGVIMEQVRPRGVALPGNERGGDLLRYYDSLEFRYTLGCEALAGTRPTSAWASPGAAEGFAPYEYAAIITTSGTTGRPRCVEHAACARLAAGRQYVERLRLTSTDVVCGFTSIYAGNCDLLLYHTAPQVGAKVVLLDAFTPESACALIEREKVTAAIFVPTLLHRLLNYPRLREHNLTSLRFVTSFGAMLPPEVAAQAESRLGVPVIQGYGASEYGALASCAVDDPEHVRRGGVGRPLAGTEIEIRGGDGTLLPRGSIGRVYARGPYCVGGFVNDAEATESAWVDGFLPMGDLARLDEAGYLWLEGRARDIIIRGGQNISPIEIEDHLLRHPAVAEAAVVKLADPEMGERVCAFVVSARGFVAPTLEQLCAFLLDQGLAKFKLPERLELLAAMPMNPAGTKVNKQMLEESLTRAAARQ